MTAKTPAENPDLSIIIPARNEAKRIGGTLESLAKYLNSHHLGNVEVIPAIDASGHDETIKVAEDHAKLFKNFKIIHEHFGSGHKGAGVRQAMLAAHGAYRLFMDADLATPLHHLEEVQAYMKGGTDVIIGVRNLASSHEGLRKFISSFGNFLVRVVLGLRIQDTQCGFKAFRGEVAEDLFAHQKIQSWGFDMELLAVAKNRGYSIQTIDIPDWKDVQGGTVSNVATQAALSTFIDLLKIKWNLLSGKYKANSEVKISTD